MEMLEQKAVDALRERECRREGEEREKIEEANSK